MFNQIIKYLKILLIIYTITLFILEKLNPQKKYAKKEFKNDTNNLIIGFFNRFLLQFFIKKINKNFVKIINFNVNALPINEFKTSYGVLTTQEEGSVPPEQSSEVFSNKNKKTKNYNIIDFIVKILLIDLYMYLWHRLNHSKYFWLFHKYHHQDTMMNTTSAVRFSPMEILFSSIFKNIILTKLGINKKEQEFYETLLFFIIIFHHSNIKINDAIDNKLEKIITSPSFHRLHHSNKIEDYNNNYGSILSIWDKIFLTYKKNKPSNIIDFGV